MKKVKKKKKNKKKKGPTPPHPAARRFFLSLPPRPRPSQWRRRARTSTLAACWAGWRSTSRCVYDDGGRDCTHFFLLIARLSTSLHHSQLSVINRGAFGLVILCRETDSGDSVAVKLIERGHKVGERVRERRHRRTGGEKEKKETVHERESRPFAPHHKTAIFFR